MKKYIYMAFALISGAFSSCTDKDEVEIHSALTVTTHLETAVLGFQEFFKDDLVIPDGYRIRVTNYVYDVAGKLVAKESYLAEQYTDDVKINFVLPDGDYKILATADVIKGTSLTNVEIEYYTASNTNDINTFQIDGNDFIKFNGIGIFSAGSYDLELKEGMKDIRINVQPLTALFLAYIGNIHTKYTMGGYPIEMTELGIGYDTDIKRAIYSSNKWNYLALSATTQGFMLDNVDLTDSEMNWDEYENSYLLVSLFPGTYKFYGFYSYIWEKDYKKYYETTDYSNTLNVVSGKQYSVIFDVKTLSVTFEEASSSSRSSKPTRSITPNCNKVQTMGNSSIKVKDFFK